MAWALAILAGLAQAASMAAPWDGQPVWWLQILSLSALVVLLQRAATWKNAGLLGWLFATAWISGCTWWLYISMHTYGGLAAPLAALAVLGLSAFLALYYAAASAAFFRLIFESNGPEVPASALWSAIVFAALWLMAELARNTWLTGFPWGAGGYAHGDGPWADLVKFTGVYGLGLLVAVLAALLAQALLQSRKGQPWVLLLAVAALLQGGAGLAGGAFSTGSGTQTVALLQGNIPQGEKFDQSRGVPVALNWYADQLLSSTATLVVAPETAIPLLPRQLPEGYWTALTGRFASGQQSALIGIPQGSFADGYSNSAIGLQPGKLDPYRYDKHHLVPFGEFIPTGFRWFTQLMNIPLGDFNRGAVGQGSLVWAGQRWAPNICYEDLFGEEIGARFADAATAPTVLVNMSNIGWFGDSIAIDQHLQISRMRALEFERPMIRATNTGATVIIDHRGRVTASLPRHTRGVLAGEVQGRTGITPFAWWVARFGLWPLWILAIAIVLVAINKARARTS